MFYQKPFHNQVPEPKRRGNVLLRLVIALNVLMLIVAIGYVAWMPGGEGSVSARAQGSGNLTSWNIPNLPASSGSASSEAAAAGAKPAVPEAAMLGGMTPTPAPSLPTMQPVPPGNEIGGTCIAGHIIDVYHNARGAGFEISVREDRDGATAIRRQADQNGYFQFPGLAGGTYVVELSIPEGWRAFTPATFKVTLSGEGSNCAQVRFKLEALACLEVIKLDESGNPLGNMIGIPGWKMNASSGQINLLQETDGEGKAYFRNLIPGRWTVQEETRNGWMPAEGYLDTTSLDLPSPFNPGECQPVVFVNKQVHTGCIAPKKVDINGQPQAGWKFSLRYKEGTQRTQEGITDASGVVYFTNLALGDWIVEEVLDAEQARWWRAVTPRQQEVHLDHANNLCTQPIFTNEQLGGIRGYKINHLEEGLQGWKITVKNDSTGETFSTTTDVDGFFHFEGLALGSWTVSEEVRPGWTAVTPSSFQIVLDTPFTYKDVRFKNRTDKACLYVFKRDSFDNAGIPGWAINLKPAFGGEMITGSTDGTGWARFEDLTPGEWILSEVMQDGWAPDGLTSTNVTLEASGNCSTYTFYNHQTNRPPAPIVPIDPKNPTPGKQGPVNNTCSQYYTIVRGDTLSSIANRFDVTLQRLREVNSIANPNLIHPNTTLCIPIK